MNPEETERITRAAVEYLIAQGKIFESALLLTSRLSLEIISGDIGFSLSVEGEMSIVEYIAALEVEPGRLDSVRGALTEDGQAAIEEALHEALTAYHGTGTYINRLGLTTRMALSDTYPLWRETYEAQLQGDDAPLNQAVVGTNPPLFQWNGLRFRSRSEQAIAAELAKAKTLFFPLPAAVSELKKYEPDFLVCLDGKWGIL